MASTFRCVKALSARGIVNQAVTRSHFFPVQRSDHCTRANAKNCDKKNHGVPAGLRGDRHALAMKEGGSCISRLTSGGVCLLDRSAPSVIQRIKSVSGRRFFCSGCQVVVRVCPDAGADQAVVEGGGASVGPCFCYKTGALPRTFFGRSCAHHRGQPRMLPRPVFPCPIV